LNRFVTTFFSGLGARQTWETKRSMSYVLIFLAILFNPIFPIYLTREIWKVIDLFAVLPFLFLIFLEVRGVK
jgi:cytochrome c1